MVPGEDFASPAPSPDGRLIVVTRGFYKAGGNVVGSYRGRESSIWIMNRNGSDLTLLTDAPGYIAGIYSTYERGNFIQIYQWQEEWP